MPVKLTIGALQDISLDATLEYIAPKGTEENGVIMFEIKAAAKIPEDVFIRAGYSANADILIDRREGVISIPESSIEFEGTKTFVNLLTSDSRRPTRLSNARRSRSDCRTGSTSKLPKG